MADNVTLPGTGVSVSSEEVTTLNGVIITASQLQRIILALRTADATAVDLTGDAANGIDVDVTRLPALVAGTANIGDVDVLTLPAVTNAGTFAVQESGAALTALQLIDNCISGTEAQVDVVGSLPAGTANTGDVDIASIAAGDNNIGNVDIVTLPALVAGTALIGKVGIDQSTANANEVVIKSGAVTATVGASENHLGSVGMPDIVITIDATVDTNALAEGDVAFATQEVANAARVNGGTMILQNVTVIDVDDQGIGIDLIFFDANTTLGTENSAPDIDDTEAQTIIGRIQVGSGSFYDLVANRVACVTGLGLLMKAGAATTSIYVAGIARGAPTYAGGHLYIKLGFMRN